MPPEPSLTSGVSAEPLYASVDGVAYPLGREECVFQVRGAGGTHVMTPEVLSALDGTRAFRTLAEHAKAIASRMPALAGRSDAIQRVLQSLVKRGLLRSSRNYLRAGSTAPATAAPFAGVFVDAGDEPRALSRLFDSLVATPGGNGAAHRWFVLDHARDPAVVRAHRDAIAAFARATGANVAHVDAAARDRVGRRLAKSVPVAGSPWEGAAVGINLALLLAAGRRLSLLDDTMVFPLRQERDEARAVALGEGVEPETRFHPDADAALASGAAPGGDPWSRQLDWCGRTLATLLGEGELTLGDDELEGFEPSRHPELRGQSRVIATCNGERGDAIDTQALFLLEGEDRMAFCAERGDYLARLERACVARAARQPTLLARGSALPFVLDGSVLLPPSVSSDAGGSQLLGLLAGALHPESVVLQAQTHIGRIRYERADRAQLFAAETPGFGQYLADALGAQLDRVRAEQPESRLRSLAAMVEDLADASLSIRVDLLHEYVRFRRSELIDRLQHAFAAFPGAPVYWQADVRELINVNGRALTEAAPPRLAGWPATLDESGCAERLQRELRSFAALLHAWPALWRAAAEQGDGLLAD